CGPALSGFRLLDVVPFPRHSSELQIVPLALVSVSRRPDKGHVGACDSAVVEIYIDVHGLYSTGDHAESMAFVRVEVGKDSVVLWPLEVRSCSIITEDLVDGKYVDKDLLPVFQTVWLHKPR
ncbi:hypothetical protein STEG23_033786, partial [Scotinomys teguina]